MSTEAHILAITIAHAKLTLAQQEVHEPSRSLMPALDAVRDAVLTLEKAIREAGGYES